MFKFILTLLTAALLMPSVSAFAGDPEAYVVYSNGTLTFKYDDQKPDGAYALNTGFANVAWNTRLSTTTTVIFDYSFRYYRPTTCSNWFYGGSSITSIVGMSENLNTENVTQAANMFKLCSSLESIDLSRFNTANITRMDYMFQSCSSLTELDLTNFNTSNVTTMQSMFDGCSNLNTILVSDKWSVASLQHSENMFSECGTDAVTQDTREAYVVISNGTLTFKFDNQKPSSNAYSLNTGKANVGWNTKWNEITKVVFDDSFRYYKPTTCSNWFYGGSKITSIEGMSQNLNTEAVTQTYSMFKGCSQLSSIDFSHFNTSSIENMESMFQLCSSLTALDLSNFNTSEVTNMQMMFDDCSNLKTIIVGDGWTTDKVNHSTNMFSDCTNLVGGEGTTYDASKTDKTYAIVDGGSSAPGYLTKRKNITSIAIATLPTKTEYNIGESLDLTGGQLEVTFDDNSKKTYDLAIAEITGFNSQNVAELTLEVKYSGQKTTFAVTILDPKTPVAKIPVDQNIAKVWSSNRTIFIETQPDTKYTIIDINGRLITTSTTKSTREEIQVNYNGVLVVIIGNNSYKVLN
ncbi:MAG: BspA family leucine-rich repeat surface protein [Bacteroidales bacterium]|nr:BspA family leucine-rich repeat surface protein [Bacteroidales bacterium]